MPTITHTDHIRGTCWPHQTYLKLQTCLLSSLDTCTTTETHTRDAIMPTMHMHWPQEFILNSNYSQLHDHKYHMHLINSGCTWSCPFLYCVGSRNSHVRWRLTTKIHWAGTESTTELKLLRLSRFQLWMINTIWGENGVNYLLSTVRSSWTLISTTKKRQSVDNS